MHDACPSALRAAPPPRLSAPLFWLTLLSLLLAVLACRPALAEVIYYPRNASIDDPRGDYGYALLALALKEAGGRYEALQTPMVVQQNRAIVELMADSHRIDILATMTSREREQKLLPIRIPMTKGLIGWRIGLVRSYERERFAHVETLAALRQFDVGQGDDWPDTEILRAAGFTVRTVSTYDSLFGLLKAGNVEWLPRSLNEIWSEAKRYPALAIEPNLLLRYPAADYFFVNRHNTELAEQVRRGLELAIADGSFERLFLEHYGDLIQRARLDQRRIIDIPNPLLSEQTPLARKELWLTIDELKRLKLLEP